MENKSNEPRSDRAIAVGYSIVAKQMAELWKEAFDEYISGGGSLKKVCFPELLEEMKNYQPKNYKPMKFKNRFAVKGDIIQLLQFEKALLKLGYSCAYPQNVFNYRGAQNDPAEHITCGLHFHYRDRGTYIPAINDASAEKKFDLAKQFDEAVSYAAEVEPEKKVVLVTEDGVARFTGDDVWYVRPNFTHYHWMSVKADKGTDKVSGYPGYKFFSSEELCKQYIDENEKKYSKKDIEAAIRKHTKLAHQGGYSTAATLNHDLYKELNIS